MAIVEPSRTLAILLGASGFPLHPTLPGPKSFETSSRDFRDYLVAEFGLPPANILDLFDSAKSPSDIDHAIGEFLERRVGAEAAPASDLLIHYVGHGGFYGPGREYYLTLKNTRAGAEGVSSLRMVDLAHTLDERARSVRRYLILDCCFAASAFKELMSSPLEAAVKATEDVFPSRGTALLCAAGRSSAAEAPENESHTMFSGALMTVLRNGDPAGPSHLTMSDVAHRVHDAIRLKFSNDAVRPEVHSPRQPEGNIAHVALFPNSAHPRAVGSSALEESPPAPPAVAREAEAEVTWWAEVVSGPEKGRRIELNLDRTGIGRSGTNELRLQSLRVSQRHAHFVRVGAGCEIEDLRTADGTYLNGARVQDRMPVRHGDSITVGGVVILVSRELRAAQAPRHLSPGARSPEEGSSGASPAASEAAATAPGTGVDAPTPRTAEAPEQPPTGDSRPPVDSKPAVDGKPQGAAPSNWVVDRRMQLVRELEALESENRAALDPREVIREQRAELAINPALDAAKAEAVIQGAEQRIERFDAARRLNVARQAGLRAEERLLKGASLDAPEREGLVRAFRRVSKKDLRLTFDAFLAARAADERTRHEELALRKPTWAFVSIAGMVLALAGYPFAGRLHALGGLALGLAVPLVLLASFAAFTRWVVQKRRGLDLQLRAAGCVLLFLVLIPLTSALGELNLAAERTDGDWPQTPGNSRVGVRRDLDLSTSYASELKTSRGAFCQVSSVLEECSYATKAECEEATRQTYGAGGFLHVHQCVPRPATAYCFQFEYPGRNNNNCFPSLKTCEAERNTFRPPTLEWKSEACVPLELGPGQVAQGYRRLRPAERLKLRDALSHYAVGNVLIQPLSGEPGAAELAGDFAGVLADAGWTTQSEATSMTESEGVVVKGGARDEFGECLIPRGSAAQRLADAVTTVGLGAVACEALVGTARPVVVIGRPPDGATPGEFLGPRDGGTASTPTPLPTAPTTPAASEPPKQSCDQKELRFLRSNWNRQSQSAFCRGWELTADARHLNGSSGVRVPFVLSGPGGIVRRCEALCIQGASKLPEPPPACASVVEILDLRCDANALIAVVRPKPSD